MNKKLTLLFIVSGLIIFAACKTTSKATASNTMEISEVQIDIAKKRWSNATVENLKNGRTIFTGKCTNCHKAYTIEGFSEKKWNHEIDDMSPKASLSAQEKQDLTMYILSFREMRTQAK